MNVDVEAVLEALGSWGLIQTLGMEIRLQPDGTPVCRLALDERHQGGPGIAHGGTLMTLLDTALGAAALAYSLAQNKATSTVEMKVNFLRPAKLGTTLVTETQIQSAGKSLLVVSGTALDESSNEKIGLALGTFNLFEPKLRSWTR